VIKAGARIKGEFLLRPTCCARIHLSRGFDDFVTFLSFLQDGCNRLLLESLVVLSLESHVGSVYQSSRLSIPSAIKKPPKNSPAENRISSEFLDFTD
jgi:hypothetical protein